jgi:hypothetical protein
MRYDLDYIASCNIDESAVREFLSTAVVDWYERRVKLYQGLMDSIASHHLQNDELENAELCLKTTKARLAEYESRQQFELF